MLADVKSARRAALLALFVTTGAAAAPRVSGGIPVTPLAAEAAKGGHLRGFPTGKVPVTVALSPTDDAAALGLLEVAPGIGTKWVSPDELQAFGLAHAGRSPTIWPPLHALLDKSATLTAATAAHAAGSRGKGVVVGIVDTGLDVSHPDLRDPQTKKSRVAWLIDFSLAPQGLHPELEKKHGCTVDKAAPCAVLSGADIDDRLANGGKLPTDTLGHGTHVAGIAAGNGGAKPEYVGVAPDATLVVARVTRDAGGDGISDADILNAVRFVYDQSDALGMPVAVNISLGGDFGPHDGASPLERGLASFVGPEHPGHAMVVAAGNSGVLYVLDTTDGGRKTMGVHTEMRAIAGARTRAVLSMPVAGQTTLGAAYVWIHARPGQTFDLSIEKNGEVMLGPIGPGDAAATPSKDPYAAIWNATVGGTSPMPPGTAGAVAVLDGEWKSDDEFALVVDGDASVELWVQGAGDAALGSEQGGLLFFNALKASTINTPASHPDLLAVGCTLNRLSWPSPGSTGVVLKRVGGEDNPPPDGVCYFSSAGPNADGVAKPEISAPGGFVSSSMSAQADPAKNMTSSMFFASSSSCPAGLPTCFKTDATHAVAAGTSMSAPQVTGAVALLLEKDPTLTEARVVAALQGGARKFTGHVPYEWQLGPGALDVVGALAALDDSKDRPPVAEKSWLHVSVGYARPDPTWPVVGAIEVRDAEGRPADGFDPSLVTVEVENGRLSKSPSRVGPGLFRFEVVGVPSTGGRRMGIVARVGQEEIGRRSLAISPDAFTTTNGVDASGGCSVAAAGSWGWGGGLALAGIALLGARRRRRS